MLKKIALTNFTAFKEAELNFAKGVNVLIGKNSVGKSHLLKLGYTLLFGVYEAHRDAIQDDIYTSDNMIRKKLYQTFNTDIYKLVRHNSGADSLNFDYEITATDSSTEQFHSEFQFVATSSEKVVATGYSAASPAKEYTQPVYIPPKEILSIYPGLAQAIEDRELSFDHTYYDLAKALGRKPLKGKRLEDVSAILESIEKDMFNGGMFVEKDKQFYFEKESVGELEAPLVAEGLCKVGMLAHLLRNGSLMKGSTLFWDEPESNLNPQLLKLTAKAMASLAEYGVQIILATHSLFLMRELDILSRTDECPVRFFGLSESADGVLVSQGDSIEDIDNIQSLEAELEQSGRYLALEYENE